ncbi:MAG: ROK family protein [Deltaproteobacteria bacterium]|nr:ROK family protein [Deltaproteobacteria bacterium]
MQKTKNNELPVLAIDLGGTKIAAALISPDNRVMDKAHSPTLVSEGLQPVIDRIFSMIDHLLSQGNTDPAQLYGIAIAAAGAIDTNKGLITSSPNLPGWLNIPLRDIVRKRYRVDTCLLNDANAAALAEHRLGAGRGTANLIYLTVSTGIGGGIIINGELYSGISGCAGEIGHMTIDANGPECNCGNTGCLEVLASGTAVASEAKRRIKQGESSRLTDIVSGDLEGITAEKVAMAAQGGDRLAIDVISRAATYLGVGMVNLVNIFNPEMIIVGGGLSKMGELLLGPARQVVKQQAFPLCSGAVRIVTAGLGDEAGVLGAAIYARQF